MLRNAFKRHRVLAALFLLVGVGFLVAGMVLFAVAFTPTPDIATFADRQVGQSTRIYDRTGQVLLYDYNRDERRELVPLSRISPYAINAVIATEDASFYDHGGIRVSSIIRAALADIVKGSFSQGGSTITQQVVKNTLLTKEKSLVRKVQEWALAVKLEQSYSKQQIIETYLNTVAYGGTLYGIEAASESFFGVSAEDLSLPQAAYLAAVIQAPSYYSPYGTHRDDLEKRKRFVLKRMQELGFISEEEFSAAMETEVVFRPRGQHSIIAPHFAFYVLDELEKRYGTNALINGLSVTTTLDADLQTKMEDIVQRNALENEKKFNASNAALVALDPKTGQILSMVGSRDFFDESIDGQYNASLGKRQPGSAMKPFIYALALLNGYTRNTVLFDVPTQFSTACAPYEVERSAYPCYAPQNYDGKFRGPMTFETALAQSINIPAVKVLYLVGVRQAVSFAKSMGLSTLGSPDTYGLTLVLGGGEVRLLDIVSGYGVFASGGIRNTPAGILSVRNAAGETLESFSPEPSRIIPEQIAHDMSAMLSNNPARVPSYAINSPLYIPGYDVAVKTGTTNDTRDAWVVGYTPSIAIGVWAGNNDNTPMVKSVAGFIAAPMWREAMDYALLKYPKGYFGAPTTYVSTLPPALRGYWRSSDGDTNTPHSILHMVGKRDPQHDTPDTSDPQYSYWEYGISAWHAAHPELFVNPPVFAPIEQPLPLGDG